MTEPDNLPSSSVVKPRHCLVGEEATLLGGRVTVFQPQVGDRASLDSILLAASLEAKDECLLEAGCGSGAAFLCAAYRLPKAYFIGIDIDSCALSRAAAGIAHARMEARCALACTSIGSPLQADMVDQCFANPPYYRPGSIASPHPARRRVLTGPPVTDWLGFMLHVTRPGGMITMIHRAAALADIVGYLASRAGGISVLPVYSRPGRHAKRILVRARSGGRGSDVIIHPPLELYDDARGGISERMRAIQNGRPLMWN